MASKFDFDIIIAGDGLEPWLLAHLLARRKFDVLVIPPNTRVPESRDLIYMTHAWISALLKEGLSLPPEEGKINSWGYFHRGSGMKGSCKGFTHGFTLERLWDYWKSTLQFSGKIRLAEDLDVKSLKQDGSGVMVEGLSPTWDFRYRARHMIIFPSHPVLRTLGEFPLGEKSRLHWAAGDFEDSGEWGAEFRGFPSPEGFVETWALPRNSRRYLVPLNFPMEPYTSDTLRQTLPGITGVELKDRRQVWESVKTLGKFPDWAHIRGRLIHLDLENGTYPGAPGNLSAWQGFLSLREAMDKVAKEKKRGEEILTLWQNKENLRAKKLRKVWVAYENLGKPLGALWGLARGWLISRKLSLMVKLIDPQEDKK